jgi:serine/threonine-protein kinase
MELMGQRCGDYELIRHIATGGMAEIFLARHNAGLDRIVVIKRMLPELAVRPDFVQMFIDEARLTASLQHPHVVRAYELGQADNAYFIAMELVDGPHLGALFAHSLRAKQPPTVELCAWIAARAADGLHYAHDRSDPATGLPLQLVHRDISPQNILVSRHGEVKITDFGVAKANSQQNKTRTGIVKGKVSYMSPEQCLGESVDRRTDVFALGVVLYELLTRRRLFRDKSELLVMQRITTEVLALPSSINPEVDDTLDAIVMKSLARPLEDRFQTASALAEALDAWLTTTTRSVNALAMSQWFAAHCPELAPTTTLVALIEATVAVPFSPPDAPASATRSLLVGSTQPETAAMGPPHMERGRSAHLSIESTLVSPVASTVASLGEATTISAPPTFDDGGPNGVARGTALSPSLPPSTLTSSAATARREVFKPRLTVPVLVAVIGVVLTIGVVAMVQRGGVGAASSTPPTSSLPSVPALARLVVTTVPAGVRILVGDRLVGNSPVTVDRPPGPVLVQAQFSEQPFQSKTIEVGTAGEVAVEFLARVPLVVRSTPDKAKVLVNGELLGETPYDGGHLVDPREVLTLRLEPSSGGFQSHESEIVASPGQTLTVEVDLLAKTSKKAVDMGRGSLSMRTEPSAQVLVDNAPFAETPFVAQPLKAGRHAVRVVNAEAGLNDRFVVTVPKDKTLVVIVKYDKTAAGWKPRTKTMR